MKENKYDDNIFFQKYSQTIIGDRFIDPKE